jgi:hypothetical protein
MRSADAPVRRFYTGPTESSAEVHVEYMKDREWASTQNNAPEPSANRQWQNTWRRRHPIIYRNQSWLYRTTRKIQAELMNGFPELPEKRLYRTIMEDLKDAFPGELETRTDCQPRLITATERVLSLPKTQTLLKSFQIPCDVFYSVLDARRHREHADLRDVWGHGRTRNVGMARSAAWWGATHAVVHTQMWKPLRIPEIRDKNRNTRRNRGDTPIVTPAKEVSQSDHRVSGRIANATPRI